MMKNNLKVKKGNQKLKYFKIRQWYLLEINRS